MTDETTPSNEVVAQEELEGHQPTVLLIEDNDLTRFSMAETLVKEGYLVLTAASGHDAVSILDQSVSNQRRHYIKQQVNGAGLHALLARIPYPKQPAAIPAAATTLAPATATAHV